MKKLLLIFTFLLLPYQAQAGGIYDGIWQTSDSTYSTVNQNGNTIIVVGLDLIEGDFAVSTGTLIGNEVILTSVIGNAQVTSRAVLTSLTTATFTLLSCVPNPGYICVIPIGTTALATKVF